MRNRLSLLLVAAVMIAVLAVPSAVAQAPGGTTMAPKASAGKAAGDEHPAIRKALEKLNEAHEILRQHAKNDYQGHKNKALKSIDEAVQELKICEGMTN